MKVLWLPAAHPAALRFLRLAVPWSHSVISLPCGGVHPRRPGVGHPVSPAGECLTETSGSPTFLGNPIVPLPCSRTPAGPSASGHCDAPVLPPRAPRRRPQQLELSRLNRTASTRAVYASQWLLPHTTQDSLRLLAKLYRRD